MHRVDVGDSAVAALAARRGMAARVAHDVNNLLTPLIAYPELIRMQADGNEKIVPLLGAMEKAANDMLYLTGRLGAFAKGQEHAGEVALASTVREVVDEFVDKGVAGIDFSVEAALADCLVPLNYESLQEVARQLIENGVDASASSGSIAVKLRLETLLHPVPCAGGMLRKGRYAVLSVTDRGGGLADGDVDQAFEPLYTTRKADKGRGAGTGLCVALAILSDAGGGIELLDTPGEGVTAQAFFPLSSDADAVSEELEAGSLSGRTETQGVPPIEATSRYHGRVLIVDDEESIVDVFTIMLSEELPGIVVDSASDGESGVRQFEATQPDVVILDLHMPIMDGLTAFKRMLEVSRDTGRPMPKVIFCTGYAPPNEFDQLMSERDAVHEVLYKPVSTRDLVDRVAQGVRHA